MLHLVLASPSTLQTGQPAPPPIAQIILLTLTLACFAAVLIYFLRSRTHPAVRAYHKIAKAHKIDPGTKRSLERCSQQLELKSPAGLLLSPTILVAAIERTPKLSKRDHQRLANLALDLAAEQKVTTMTRSPANHQAQNESAPTDHRTRWATIARVLSKSR